MVPSAVNRLQPEMVDDPRLVQKRCCCSRL